MNGRASEIPLCPVPVRLTVGLPAADRSAHNRLPGLIQHDLGEAILGILEDLGLPGVPVVDVSVIDASSSEPGVRGLSLAFSIHGSPVDLSADLVPRAFSLALRRPLWPLTTRHRANLDSPPLPGDSEELAAGIVSACSEAVRCHPSCLLQDAQVTSILEHLNLAATPAAMRPVFAALLELRLGLGRSDTIAEVLRGALSRQVAPYELIEELAAALRPAAIEIRLAPSCLRALTIGLNDTQEKIFALMRDGLFYELGLILPEFRLVPGPDVPDGAVCFRINDLTGLPWPVPAPGQYLVNDTVERLRLLGIEAQPAANPANHLAEFAFADGPAAAKAKEAGLTVWDPLGYVVLCFTAELRRHAASLFDRKVCDRMIEQLESVAPALVKLVRERVPPARLTAALRRLLKEEVSIRDMRSILDRALDFDHVVADEAKLILFDDRIVSPAPPDDDWLQDPAQLAAFIRIALKRYLSHKYTRGQSTLECYLVDPTIEQRLAEGFNAPAPTGADDFRKRLIEAVGREEEARTGVGNRVVLTTVGVRRSLRNLIAHAFPRLPVVAYQELSPEMNIQPVARITLR